MTTVSFSDIINFSRSSSGTYFDSSGVLQSAAINAPRFDYDPSTLQRRGLLIEGAATNNYLFSQDINNAYWGKAAGSTAAGSTISGITFTRFTPDTSNSTHAVTRPLTMPAGSTVTLSWVAKADGYQRLSLRVAPGGVLLGRVIFDIVTGVITQNSASIPSSITPLGGGVFRISTTFPLGVGVTAAAANLEVATITNAITFIGDGVSGILISAAQAENGQISSIIPTTAAAATRSADIAVINTLSPWFGGSSGTLFVEAETAPTDTAPAAQEFVTLFGANPDNDRLNISKDSGGTQITCSSVVGGVAQTSGMTPSGATPGSTVFKAAFGFAQNDFGFSVSGSAASTNGAGSLPSIVGAALGQRGNSTLFANGYLRRVNYYPRRLSNIELQALTS